MPTKGHCCARARSADLRSQRFWDHITYLTVDRIRAAERVLTHRLVEEFHVDLSTVVYDATNFHTWIDTQTPSTRRTTKS